MHLLDANQMTIEKGAFMTPLCTCTALPLTATFQNRLTHAIYS